MSVTYPTRFSWRCFNCNKPHLTLIRSADDSLYCEYCITRTTPVILAAQRAIMNDALFEKARAKLAKVPFVEPKRRIKVRR